MNLFINYQIIKKIKITKNCIYKLRPVPQKLIRDPNRDLDRDTNSIYLPLILCIRHLGFSASLIRIICFLLKFIFVYFINCVYTTRKKIIFEFIIVYIVLCMHIARVNYMRDDKCCWVGTNAQSGSRVGSRISFCGTGVNHLVII